MSRFKPYGSDSGERGYLFHCPGCGAPHQIRSVAPKGGPCWTVSGGLDDLTASPSLRVNWGDSGPKRGICHSFVTGGRINLLGDSTAHQLRGWHDIPDWETS